MQYDVIIATPGFNVSSQYLSSLMNTIDYFHANAISYKVVNYGSAYVRTAREAVVNNGHDYDIDTLVPFMGEFDYKYIMWIDNDIEWKPEDIVTLMNSPHDVVCGGYVTTNGTLSASLDGAVMLEPSQFPNNDEFEVATCGFGFLCIKKGVFEKMPKPWFDNEIITVNGNRIMTFAAEDVSWCYKARRSGFSIWFNPNVRVKHYKTVGLEW